MKSFKMFFENYARQEHLKDFLTFVKKFFESDPESDMLRYTVENAALWHKLHGPTMWDVAYNQGMKYNHKINFNGKLIRSVPQFEESEQSMKATIRWDKEKNKWYIVIPSIGKDGFITLEDAQKYFVFVDEPHDYIGQLYTNTMLPFKDFMFEKTSVSHNINTFIKILDSQIHTFYDISDEKIKNFEEFTKLLRRIDLVPIYIDWLENNYVSDNYRVVIIKFLEELLPTLIQLQGID